MSAFVRISAVLVGLANAIAYYLIGSSERLLGDDAGDLLPLTHLLLFVLLVVVAGLLVSQLALALMGWALQGHFFVRYGAMALAVSLGGMLIGVLWLIAAALLDGYGVAMTPSAVLYGASLGGVLGLIEGLFLGIPLAALLGLLRRRPIPR